MPYNLVQSSIIFCQQFNPQHQFEYTFLFSQLNFFSSTSLTNITKMIHLILKIKILINLWFEPVHQIVWHLFNLNQLQVRILTLNIPFSFFTGNREQYSQETSFSNKMVLMIISFKFFAFLSKNSNLYSAFVSFPISSLLK